MGSKNKSPIPVPCYRCTACSPARVVDEEGFNHECYKLQVHVREAHSLEVNDTQELLPTRRQPCQGGVQHAGAQPLAVIYWELSCSTQNPQQQQQQQQQQETGQRKQCTSHV